MRKFIPIFIGLLLLCPSQSLADVSFDWNGRSLTIPENFNPVDQLLGLYRGNERVGYQTVMVIPTTGGMQMNIEKHTDVTVLGRRLQIDLSYTLWMDWEMNPLRYEFQYDDSRRGTVRAHGVVENGNLINVDGQGRVYVVSLEEADPFGYWRIATQVVPFQAGMEPVRGRQFNPLTWHAEPYCIEVLESSRENVEGKLWTYYHIRSNECGNEETFWMREDLQIVSGNSAFGITSVPENAALR